MNIQKQVSTVYKDTDSNLEFVFEPIEDTISVEKTENGLTVQYLTRDEDYSCKDLVEDESCFLVNYHRDFRVENKAITEAELGAWYNGEQIEQEKTFRIFKVSALIHGGVWLSLDYSFGADPGGWDTSHVGAVLVSRKEWRLRKAAAKVAAGLLETWNSILSGDVYAVVCQTHNKDGVLLDRNEVWGFIGLENAQASLRSGEYV